MFVSVLEIGRVECHLVGADGGEMEPRVGR